MKNLDQLRAAHALTVAADTDKASSAKLPSMILSNGLLATLAFACEQTKNEAKRPTMNAAANGLAVHLRTVLPEAGGATSGKALAENLAKGEALTLQRATIETLAYLSYLKRFAPSKDETTYSA